MEKLYLFIGTFIVTYIIYQIFLILPRKVSRKKKNRKKKKELIEIKYLVTKYHLDLDKINYNRLLQVVALVSSIDITIMVNVVVLVKSYLLALLLALVIAIPCVFISYYIVGFYYKKKGMIKNV